MIHPAPPRRALHPQARPVSLPSFSIAAMGYLALGVAVLMLGLLAAVL